MSPSDRVTVRGYALGSVVPTVPRARGFSGLGESISLVLVIAVPAQQALVVRDGPAEVRGQP